MKSLGYLDVLIALDHEIFGIANEVNEIFTPSTPLPLRLGVPYVMVVLCSKCKTIETHGMPSCSDLEKSQ
jgi:hypothetical protein